MLDYTLSKEQLAEVWAAREADRIKAVVLLGTGCMAETIAEVLQTHLYLTAKEIAHRAEETFGVAYTESGMTSLLHRLGFVYKKPLHTFSPAKPTPKPRRRSSPSTKSTSKTRIPAISCSSWMPSLPSTIP